MSEMQALGCTHPYAHEERIFHPGFDHPCPSCEHCEHYGLPNEHCSRRRMGWWCHICEREIHPGSSGIISKWAAPPGALSLYEPDPEGGLSLTPDAGALSVRPDRGDHSDLRDATHELLEALRDAAMDWRPKE